MPKNYFKQTYFLKIFGWGENFLAQPGSSWFTRNFLVNQEVQKTQNQVPKPNQEA